MENNAILAPKRIICFTDNMGSGGAQRQLSYLSILLKKRGHNVVVVTYNSGDFFREELIENNIPIYKISTGIKLGRIIRLVKIISKFKPDAVIAFQETPSFIAEIAKLFNKSYKLIVSERQTIPSDQLSRKLRALKFFHRLADKVTLNSYTNLDQLLSLYPELKDRATVIYNTVDFRRFFPKMDQDEKRSKIIFAVLASHKPQKNFGALALALKHLQSQKGVPSFHVDWYGDEAPGYLAKNKAIADDLGLADVLSLHPAVTDVPSVLKACDALIHPSLWEGLPNSVCEALSCGCPVLMADVCDARQLVSDNVNGLLFDPVSPISIAAAILQYLQMSTEQRIEMGRNARVSAEHLFDESLFLSKYESLLL